jgi:hypothetical protein
VFFLTNPMNRLHPSSQIWLIVCVGKDGNSWGNEEECDEKKGKKEELISIQNVFPCFWGVMTLSEGVKGE